MYYYNNILYYIYIILCIKAKEEYGFPYDWMSRCANVLTEYSSNPIKSNERDV